MHHFDLAKPHVILVDKSGRRIADESGCYQTLGKTMYAKGAVPSFAIIESRHRDNYPWGNAIAGDTPQAWLESGYMRKADTIEGLAETLGVDRAGLRTSVERFNVFALNGVDADFGRGSRAYDLHLGDPTVKPNACIGAIEKPPFCGVMTVPGDVGTAGGLVTDEHARVLRSDGRAIDGLYATGNTTSSVMGGCYPGPGATVGPSMVFAYIAALHASYGSDAGAVETLPERLVEA
jgi:3-oxosteroid 1-dehydrogenase